MMAVAALPIAQIWEYKDLWIFDLEWTYLFTLNSNYIMRNTDLEDIEMWIKIAEKNINNLRYVDNMILKVENEQDWRNLLIKVKEDNSKIVLLNDYVKR